MEAAVFFVGAALMLVGALGVIVARNAVHSALFLVQTLFGVAVLFVNLDAHFLAAVQVIVYAGAIVVLILFVIMLLGVDSSEDLTVDPLGGQRTGALVAGVVLGLGLVGVIAFGAVTGIRSVGSQLDAGVSNPVAIGRHLFTDHLWAFEVASLLLLIAVVGAVVLARHRRDAQIDQEAVDELESGDDAAETEEVAP